MELSFCYFNPRSIMLLTLLIIGIVIIGTLITIRTKSNPIKLLLGYYLCVNFAVFLAFIPFCKSEYISYPFEIFFAISSGTFLTLFAYHFPTLEQPREARVAASILPVFTVILLLFSSILDMRYLSVGSVPTAYYDFILSILPAYNFIVLILVIRQSIRKKIKTKLLIIVAMVTSVLPSTLPLLDFLNIIPKSLTDVLLFGSLTITEMLFFLAVIESSEDTLHLNIKFTSITLCFFLFSFGMASLLITNGYTTGIENEQLLRAAAIRESIKNGNVTQDFAPDIAYIFEYPPAKRTKHEAPLLLFSHERTFDVTRFFETNTLGSADQLPSSFWGILFPVKNPLPANITKEHYYSIKALFAQATYLAYRFRVEDTEYEVGFSYEEVAYNIHRISTILMFLVIIGSTLTEILLILVANNFLVKPIRALLTSIDQVNKNQAAELPVFTDNEIGLLAREYNHLLYKIKDTTTSLVTTNQILEARVENRTEDLDTLRTITSTLNEAMTLEAALQNGLMSVMSLLDVKIGWILLLDGFQQPRLAVAYNLPGQEDMLDLSFNLQQCQCIQALKKGQWHKVEMMQECSLYKSHISIPLHIGEKPLGTINLILPTVKTLSENEYQLLNTIGEAFSAAIDRARLFESERKQRDLAETLMEVGSVLSSTLDIDQVIKEILNQVSRLVPYDSGNVMLVKGEHAFITYARGYDSFGEKINTATKAMAFKIKETANLRRMAETGKPWYISNTQANPGWIEYPGTEHIRSWVGAPIMAHGEVIAFFSLDKTTVNYYTQEHASRLAIFAAQAGLAMENARLYAHSQEDLIREQRFHRITQSLTRAFDLPKMLQDAIEQTIGLLDGDAGEIGLLSDEKTQLQFNYQANGPGITMPVLKPVLALPDGDIAWDVLSRRRPILLDLTKQPKAAPHLVKAEIISAIFAPIVSGDVPLGIIQIFSLTKDKQFTNRDLALAESIGRQTGIAIENARLFKEVQKLAITDPLTGINNRGHFFTLGLQEIERNDRYRHTLSVILLDLDHFKTVNDTYGHSTGDQVLKKVTQRITEMLRKNDILGRYGGEEFTIILPETDLDAALQAAERIRAAISDQPIVIDKDISVSLTISLGVATIAAEKSKARSAIDNFENLLEEADAALYQAKNDGRNLVRAYSGPSKKHTHRGKIPPVNGTRA